MDGQVDRYTEKFYKGVLPYMIRDIKKSYNLSSRSC